ncbi:hypothetical protein AALO_G00156660 [Alosa alosa]|uniref:Immunoglobulin domain-containing protein n=1 Tax=Alosa alosa TaxID=278164 RepID=A0AAV6GFA9_9TELE|nr:ICOS ligand-like [Alosa alosa]KAG5273878.1 hypothetical protein AALO_G00156660 [Alosa alosa]
MRMAGQYLFNWIVICILLEGKIYGAVVQEQHESMQQVTVGQRALLPCLLPLPRPSLGNIRVYWQTDKTDLVVHVFNKGQEEFGHQSSNYCNRTQLNTSQLQFGNFSLELCNVSEQDNLTTFQCIAFYDGSGRPKYQNTTTLLVLKEDVNRSHDGGAGNTTLTAVAVALLVLIVIVLVLVWGMRKRWKK